jgi:phosphoribosylanthranilate isomerase
LNAILNRDAAPDRVLLDAFAEGARGGTGKSFDWGILERAGGFDWFRVILAGGIGPDNARRASRLGYFSSFAIDANSGVEVSGSPGKKDHRKVESLFAHLKGEV